MQNIIGIDLGGTTIKGGLVSDNKIISQFAADTKANEGGEVSLNVLKDVIRKLLTIDTSGIGIGFPSIVDREKGIVYNVQNIRNWEEVHLKEILENEFHVPVKIDNDANCFAMGERKFGIGQKYENFVGITLGTGVGGGIIQKGVLLNDANCGSGEYGEMPYKDSILEAYCGSAFFKRYNTTGFDAAQKALNGDKGALELFQEFGKHLSVLVKMVVLSVDPHAIIFGGSIAHSFNLYEESMYNNLADFPYPNSIKKLNIHTSKLSNIGILGAAALC